MNILAAAAAGVATFRALMVTAFVPMFVLARRLVMAATMFLGTAARVTITNTICNLLIAINKCRWWSLRI